MKQRDIKLTALINIGPYSHVTMEMNVDLQAGENVMDVLSLFKNRATSILNGEELKVSAAPSEEEVKTEETPTLPVEEVKEKKSRAKKATVTEAPISTEAAIEPVAEVKEEVKSPAKKTIKYSRAIEAHKTLLSSTLTTNFPNWKTAKPKEEIVAFTATLEGKEFIDEDGIILESFKQVLSGFFA